MQALIASIRISKGDNNHGDDSRRSMAAQRSSTHNVFIELCELGLERYPGLQREPTQCFIEQRKGQASELVNPFCFALNRPEPILFITQTL